MARKITDANKGVSVKINPPNAVKIIQVCVKTHRTFATEVNLAVEQYVNKQLKEEK